MVCLQEAGGNACSSKDKVGSSQHFISSPRITLLIESRCIVSICKDHKNKQHAGVSYVDHCKLIENWQACMAGNRSQKPECCQSPSVDSQTPPCLQSSVQLGLESNGGQRDENYIQLPFLSSPWTMRNQDIIMLNPCRWMQLQKLQVTQSQLFCSVFRVVQHNIVWGNKVRFSKAARSLLQHKVFYTVSILSEHHHHSTADVTKPHWFFKFYTFIFFLLSGATFVNGTHTQAEGANNLI